MTELQRTLQYAITDLACGGCRNRGYVTTPDGKDECPDCRGETRNDGAVRLLTMLVERVEAMGSKQEGGHK